MPVAGPVGSTSWPGPRPRPLPPLPLRGSTSLRRWALLLRPGCHPDGGPQPLGEGPSVGQHLPCFGGTRGSSSGLGEGPGGLGANPSVPAQSRLSGPALIRPGRDFGGQRGCYREAQAECEVRMGGRGPLGKGLGGSGRGRRSGPRQLPGLCLSLPGLGSVGSGGKQMTTAGGGDGIGGALWGARLSGEAQAACGSSLRILWAGQEGVGTVCWGPGGP